MFKVAIAVFSVVALGATIQVARILAQPDQSTDWAASLQSAARELDIELTPECLAELRTYIAERGFERGAVTARGVLVRDLSGEDKWLCL